MSATILRGDALALPIADESVDLIVTSPPYFALRSYTDAGEHYAGQLGSEVRSPEMTHRVDKGRRPMQSNAVAIDCGPSQDDPSGRCVNTGSSAGASPSIRTNRRGLPPMVDDPARQAATNA